MPCATDIGEILAGWAADGTGRLVTARLDIPATMTRAAPLPPGLSPGTLRALERSGISFLYSHQAEAFDLLGQGHDVVVSTPTASGKSLCYTLPIIEALSRDPGATALLMFPTKALGRDQVKGLEAMIAQAGIEADVAAYDGDVSAGARRLARSRARILLTNPDMLHLGILPHHTSWSSFFGGLRYVVVDELHQYRGVFGSHMANVMRRLARVLRFYGANPSFVGSSATIANPAQLASSLFGRPVRLVASSGAPSGHRTVVFMTPHLVDAVSGLRGSYMHLAAHVAGDLTTSGLQTLVFAQSRRGVEVALRYVRDHVRNKGMDPDTVQGYRGGYLPALRRRIEDGLRAGGLRCVVATNALELGVDIGSLDAVVLAGYPGSVASTWQRIGRAGRRLDPSLAVLVGSASPLDQYMVSHAQWLASASPERSLVNPDNLDVVLGHVRCALFELPFEKDEPFGTLDMDAMEQVMSCLEAEGLAHRAGTHFCWVANEYPGATVNLRSVGPEPFVVTDVTVGDVLGDVDGRSAFRMLHEQAIYQHAGMPYLVKKLDLDRHRAEVVQVDPEYYTEPVASTLITPIEEQGVERRGDVQIHLGEVRMVEKIAGYRRIRFGTHENLGTGELDLPETVMDAFALWIEVMPEGIAHGSGILARRQSPAGPLPDPVTGDDLAREALPLWVIEGLEGTGHLLRHVACLRLMCDPHDIVPAVGMGDGSTLPVLYLHESHPGGVGLVHKLYDEIAEAAAEALDALNRCPCTSGCPSCVGPPHREDSVLKQATRLVLSIVTGHAD